MKPDDHELMLAWFTIMAASFAVWFTAILLREGM